jgi:hypothetical protein
VCLTTIPARITVSNLCFNSSRVGLIEEREEGFVILVSWLAGLAGIGAGIRVMGLLGVRTSMTFCQGKL